MSRATSERRLDPPQRAAVAISVAAPLAVGITYVALRTDWLRRAARWLVRAGGALAGLPWADIGFVVLALTATVAVPVVLGWTAVLVPEAIGMLWRWRLTPTETLRVMAAVAFGIGANVAAVIWWVWFVFCVSDAASGSNPLAAYGFLWMFITGVEPAVWLRLAIRLRKPTEPDCLAARIVAPRQAELYERLLDSLDRFEKDHHTGEKTPFGGDDEYAIDLTTVESRRNEWIRDNLDDLDAYAEYHPSFAKALGEWRTTQEKED